MIRDTTSADTNLINDWEISYRRRTLIEVAPNIAAQARLTD